MPVAAAYAFFAAGLLLQRLAMLPVAALVFDQEAAEGSYRFDQMRFRAWAAEIALYRCVIPDWFCFGLLEVFVQRELCCQHEPQV
jgi:hypothetical protein